MPWRVTCPKCQSSTRTRETAAFAMTCPQCGHKFDVEAAVTPWSALARGCRWVIVALVLDVLALTSILVLFVGHIHWSAMDRRHAVWGEGATLTPIEVARLALYGLVVASLVAAWGRTVQAAVPRASGVVGPLRGAAIVSWLHFLVTLVGVLMLNEEIGVEQIGVGWSWGWRWSFPLAVGCLAAAVGVRFVAELSAAAALGVAAGAMPSRRLAARVSRYKIVSQAEGVGLALLAVFLVVVVLSEYGGRRPPKAVLTREWATVITVSFPLLLGSCLANLSLYTTARRAALEWKPPEPRK